MGKKKIFAMLSLKQIPAQLLLIWTVSIHFSFYLPVICLEGGVNHDTIANTLKNQHVSNSMEKKRKKSDYYTRRLVRYERRRHRKKKIVKRKSPKDNTNMSPTRWKRKEKRAT